MTRFTTFNFGTNSTPNKVVDPYTGPATQSDVLLGQTFFSTTKRQSPGLLYAGETYSWADNPKLQALFNADGHQFITDENDGTFTVVNHSDFIRAGTNNIGRRYNDTTAVNGLRFNTISGGNQVSGGVFASSATSNTPISGNQLTSKLQGDGETAPNHRRAYFGIYGDLAVITVQADLIPVEALETLIGEATASTGGTNINLNTTLDNLKTNYKYLRLIGTTNKFGDPRTEEILVRTNQLVDGFDITMEFNGSLSTFNVDANNGGNVILNNQSANAGNQNLEVWAIKEPKTVVGSNVDILDEDDFVSDRDDAVATQQSVKAYVDKITSDYKTVVNVDLDHAGVVLTEVEVRAALNTNGTVITRIQSNSDRISKNDIQATIVGINTVRVIALDGTLEAELFMASSELPEGTFAITRNNDILNYQRIAKEGIELLDEDDFLSNSESQAPSQQSVKTYVDLKNTTLDTKINALQTKTHDAVTLDPFSDPALELNGQELKLVLPSAIIPEVLDEDNFSTNSDTQAPSQQSVKAYVDTSLNDLIDSAPGTLDTLGEIATALQDNDSEIGALVAVDTAQTTRLDNIDVLDTTQNTRLDDLEDKTHDAVTLSASSSTALELNGQELTLTSITLDADSDPELTLDEDNRVLKLTLPTTVEKGTISREILKFALRDEFDYLTDSNNRLLSRVYTDQTFADLKVELPSEITKLSVISYDGLFLLQADSTTGTNLNENIPRNNYIWGRSGTDTLRATQVNPNKLELIDEDDLVSDRDDVAPSQQSVKAYIDNKNPQVITVADEAARLALTDLKEGDEVIQTDTEDQFIFDGQDLVSRTSKRETTESDLLLGQTFYSTTKRIKKGLLYAGETYSWLENTKLKVLFDNDSHQFITDNGDDTFTIANHTDFLRAGTSAIGNFQDDSTAVNGLRTDTAGAHSHTARGGCGSGCSGTSQSAGMQSNFDGFRVTMSTDGNHTHSLSGDSETAPKHRNAYFGIYGDVAVITANAELVPVEPVGNVVIEVNKFEGSVDISSTGHLPVSVGFDITECDYIELVFADDGRDNLTDKFTWSSRIDVEVYLQSEKTIVDRDSNQYVWVRTGSQDAATGGFEMRAYNMTSQVALVKAIGYKTQEINNIVNPSADIVDEDDFVSNRADAVPTQQSVKAYVDSKIASAPVPELIDEDDFASNDDTKAPTQQSTKEYVDEEIRKVTTIGSSIYLPKDIQGNADYGVADFQEGDFDELVDGTYDYAAIPLDDADGNIGAIFVGTLNQAYRDVVPVSNYSAAEAFALNKGERYDGKLVFTRDNSTHYYIKGGQLFPLTKPETQPEVVNEETFNAVNSTKTLLKSDPIYQYLKTEVDNATVIFPTDGINGTKFVVRNDETSTKDLTVNSIVCSPGETYEAIYTGTRWMEL